MSYKKTGVRSTLWHWGMCAGAFLYIVLTVVYLLLGQLNADEGWYLYASRLVFEGKVPYRDFAYTQTPLLPYIYGFPQWLLGSSLYLGRITSAIFAILNFSLCLSLAKKYAGEIAGGVAALLLATFTLGIYFEVIVKTYALLSLLFTLTFFILSSMKMGPLRYALAVVVAMCAALVRLSAILFLVVIVLYGLLKSEKSGKLLILSLCAVAAISVMLFVMPNLEVVRWNLLTHHLSQWGPSSNAGGIVSTILQRCLSFVVYFTSYILLGVGLFVTIMCSPRLRKRVWHKIRCLHPAVIVSLGVILFAISHLITGGWHMEYFIPAVTSLIPIFSIVFTKVYVDVSVIGCLSKFQSWEKAFLQVAFVVALFMVPARYGLKYIDLSGGQSPLVEVQQVAGLISENTTPSDRVLVLEALWTVVESHTTVLPGMTMAQFSYQNIDTKAAQNLGVVNNDLLLNYIESGAPKIVVLTDLDWQLFDQNHCRDLIEASLRKRYALILRKQNFGQWSLGVYVYRR